MDSRLHGNERLDIQTRKSYVDKKGEGKVDSLPKDGENAQAQGPRSALPTPSTEPAPDEALNFSLDLYSDYTKPLRGENRKTGLHFGTLDLGVSQGNWKAGALLEDNYLHHKGTVDGTIAGKARFAYQLDDHFSLAARKTWDIRGDLPEPLSFGATYESEKFNGELWLSRTPVAGPDRTAGLVFGSTQFGPWGVSVGVFSGEEFDYQLTGSLNLDNEGRWKLFGTRNFESTEVAPFTHYTPDTGIYRLGISHDFGGFIASLYAFMNSFDSGEFEPGLGIVFSANIFKAPAAPIAHFDPQVSEARPSDPLVGTQKQEPLSPAVPAPSAPVQAAPALPLPPVTPYVALGSQGFTLSPIVVMRTMAWTEPSRYSRKSSRPGSSSTRISRLPAVEVKT